MQFSGQNSRETSKSGRNGKRLSGRRTLQSDERKLQGKEKKNRLEALLYLERHLEKSTTDYGDKTIKILRGLPSSQIKCWTRWKDIWIISQQRPHKRLQMEARWRNWLLVCRYELKLSPYISKKSSGFRSKSVL